MESRFRTIPSVDQILCDSKVQTLAKELSHDVVTDLIREELQGIRDKIKTGVDSISMAELVSNVIGNAALKWGPWPNSLINATGVILHTNLGRAPLSRTTINAMAEVGSGYNNLEYDLESGYRGSRQEHLSMALQHLTGAEAGIAVNNNASAVMIGLAAIAQNKDVLVSRGEAVEIGGGFRIPEVLSQSGANIVEIGTTNRSYSRDYEKSITENTGAILVVHPSNFKVTGFTHKPELIELTKLGRSRGVPVLHDLGSGCIVKTEKFGLMHEPTPIESIEAGVDLAFFSGDKLLGGPQAGIAIGSYEMIKKMSDHPFARAARIDKINLAGLVTTLLHYVKGEWEEQIPVWKMITLSESQLEFRARTLKKQIHNDPDVIRGFSTIGGGSLPGETLPTWLLSLEGRAIGIGSQELAKRLRNGLIPVIPRIDNDKVLLDPRTVDPEEEISLVTTVNEAMK